jgi:hypothetical protein
MCYMPWLKQRVISDTVQRYTPRMAASEREKRKLAGFYLSRWLDQRLKPVSLF